MNRKEGKKRLFFGMSLFVPWPDTFPKGRVLDMNSRHLTLAFLGDCFFSELYNFPVPSYSLGSVGYFDELLFLPKRKPKVASWHLKCLIENGLFEYQRSLIDWLLSCGYELERRDFLPHVTVARSPFNEEEWSSAFKPLPFCLTGLHLYESLGNLVYKPLKSYPLLQSIQREFFGKSSCFLIRWKELEDLFISVQMAIAYAFPNFIENVLLKESFENLKSLERTVENILEQFLYPFRLLSLKTVSFERDRKISTSRLVLIEKH